MLKCKFCVHYSVDSDVTCKKCSLHSTDVHVLNGVYIIDHIDCLEHKHGKYMLLTHDKRVQLTNNQYVSYALLSLAGSMHLNFCGSSSRYLIV